MAIRLGLAKNLVNNPKTDDPRCLEPVRMDRNLFERQWWSNE
jgi:hypothetical protein